VDAFSPRGFSSSGMISGSYVFWLLALVLLDNMDREHIDGRFGHPVDLNRK